MSNPSGSAMQSRTRPRGASRFLTQGRGLRGRIALNDEEDAPFERPSSSRDVYNDEVEDDDDENAGLLVSAVPMSGALAATPRTPTEYPDAPTRGEIALRKINAKPSQRERKRSWWWGGRSDDAPGPPRTVTLGDSDRQRSKYPKNVVRNQKYNVFTFLPFVLYEQFKFFFNLYFLLVALSQFIPALKIGFIATYVAPLAFVLAITIGKEALDDLERYRRDNESNSQPYRTLVQAARLSKKSRRRGRMQLDAESEGDKAVFLNVPSSQLKAGDLIFLQKNDRVPADVILLKAIGGDHSASPTEDQSDEPLGKEGFKIVLGEELDQQHGPSAVVRNTGDGIGNGADAGASELNGEEAGTCFIRTDQLDGETDWKLRVAVDLTQNMSNDELVQLGERASVYAGPPIKDIHTFFGNFTLHPDPSDTCSAGAPLDPERGGPAVGDLRNRASPSRKGLTASEHLDGTSTPIAMGLQSQVSPLTAENLLWANTVLAAGSAVGLIIYTGRETRAVMNTSHPETKAGLLDLEINRLSKILCAFTFALSAGLVALNGFRGEWWVYVFRFLILFSSIIPISLRVNLDMGKTVYAKQIQNDPEIPGTIVRTSTLPEELGRIEYLLSDKTGTLTQNEMELKKLHMGTMSYGWDAMDEVAAQLASGLAHIQSHKEDTSRETTSPSKALVNPFLAAGAVLGGRGRRDMSSRVKDVALALALCHNVTPAFDESGAVTYQASSPDEVAIVRWTESIGLTLIARDRTSISLRASSSDTTLSFSILEIFPFTSESKRMGIVIRDNSTKEIVFYQKGADVVMSKIVAENDWLDEECGNMAREGLRTLVIARKRLTEDAWLTFERQYKAARVRMEDRNEAMAQVVSQHLELKLELLGLTGVEDKLQDGVKTTLELLRNAGIKVWMLTGDKIETATCIAISSKLVARNQYVHQVAKLKSLEAARDTVDFLRSKLDCCLVIDGESLQLLLDNFRLEFIELATQLTAVVACRCSPTQKADVARLIREYTKKRVCCIGDGGNDVSMIQAADVGLGIVGKEGKQASLAADFSILQFSYVTKLLVWHGRNSYKRSAKLAQFVIHRGLIISIIQAVFSAIFYFAPIALYQGWLMVGYATIYTMAPVFSLVLDRDVSEDLALLYPELYKDLTKGRSLSAKTFTEWLIISVYQGGAIMLLSLILFENEFLNIVSISFTALVVNELIMIALEITTWHVYMVISEIVTLFLYCVSIVFLPEFFDLKFVLSPRFLWKVALIIAVSSFPLYVIKIVRSRLAPPSYSKLATS
ncbi:phospholipid-translocating P-type ATPase [Tilletiaria anomala UBC 951]|uniref:Phospholipid-transporting ATPase n=1 Tax=Tilletiaria anomala (strain ATCC 24038 / CBS 436.72 / UBC 951) TaxID=1037660 RepID=A0A066VXL7_TILAU|nr:phospholipid-translocating P-type ATPase [Tilletiaria anomala UBC 951]KDN43564.1 phospholipid-translocating P-type ATPase [Tilletiaria anomala UBC 951]